MPSTTYDAKGLLKSSIRDENPVIFIEHKLLYNTKGAVPDGEYTIPLGKAEVKREGRDVTLISYSRMTPFALEEAEELSSYDIEAEIVDLRSLSPLDVETVTDSVKKTGRVIICEEDCKTGGVGAEVLSRINEDAFDYLDAPVVRVAAKDVPIPFSPVLEKMAIPDKKSIVNAAREILKR